MPKKAHISCEKGDATFTGELPDDQVVEYAYTSTLGEIDKTLVNKLKKHHYDTGINTPDGRKLGHKHFDVLLEGGGTGQIEAFSYVVIFKRNKEG